MAPALRSDLRERWSRLDGPLAGWRARQGGRGQMITVVFRPDHAARILFIAMIAFGGRNWLIDAADRRAFPG